MQNKTTKPSVYMLILPPNEKGFTFIMTLAMVAILVMTLPFLSYTIRIVSPTTSYDELSVNEFYRFIRDELIQSYAISVADNKLYLLQEKERRATISKYGNQIRRQVDGRGHEIFLRDVEDVVFIEDAYGIIVRITNRKGTTYEKSFAFYNKE